MPWRECSVMEERLRFVARLLDGDGMSDVCREFGISRKTGYKILKRYRDCRRLAGARQHDRPNARVTGRVVQRGRRAFHHRYRERVRFFGAGKRTHSVVMTTDSKSIRFVDTVHVEGGPDAVIRF